MQKDGKVDHSEVSTALGLNRKPGRMLLMTTPPTRVSTGEFTQGLKAFNQNNPLRTTRL